MIEVFVKGVRRNYHRGSVGEKLSKSHQAEDRHCAHKTWIQKMDLKEEKLFSDEINTAWIKNQYVKFFLPMRQ